MTTTERVVFRYYEGQPPYWEAYGLDSAAYGSGDTLADARADIKSTISLLYEVDEESIELVEFQEYLARSGDGQHPDIWIRIPRVYDINGELPSRVVQNLVESFLRENPAYSFSNGVASTGDIILVATLEKGIFYATFSTPLPGDC